MNQNGQVVKENNPYVPSRELMEAVNFFIQRLQQICPRVKVEVNSTRIDLNIRVRAPKGNTPIFDVYDFFVWTNKDGKITGLQA